MFAVTLLVKVSDHFHVQGTRLVQKLRSAQAVVESDGYDYPETIHELNGLLDYLNHNNNEEGRAEIETDLGEIARLIGVHHALCWSVNFRRSCCIAGPL